MIVSRGYKGNASKNGGMVSDGRRIFMDAVQAGDEPLMMAQLLPDIPVVVGRRRFAIAMTAIERFSPEVVILDDGFQHFQLARDLDLVLLDHARPLGNTRLLPAGMLREPVDALEAAEALVFTRADAPSEKRADIHPVRFLKQLQQKRPVFATRHIPEMVTVVAESGDAEVITESPAELLNGKRVFVFCGLARNHGFLESVQQQGAVIAGQAFFADHHYYTSAELADLSAKAAGVDLLVTSHKDYVRLPAGSLFSRPLAVLGVTIGFMDEDASGRLDALVADRIQAGWTR